MVLAGVNGKLLSCLLASTMDASCLSCPSSTSFSFFSMLCRFSSSSSTLLLRASSSNGVSGGGGGDSKPDEEDGERDRAWGKGGSGGGPMAAEEVEARETDLFHMFFPFRNK